MQRNRFYISFWFKSTKRIKGATITWNQPKVWCNSDQTYSSQKVPLSLCEEEERQKDPTRKKIEVNKNKYMLETSNNGY